MEVKSDEIWTHISSQNKVKVLSVYKEHNEVLLASFGNPIIPYDEFVVKFSKNKEQPYIEKPPLIKRLFKRLFK